MICAWNLPLVLWLMTFSPPASCVVLPRPPANLLTREPPVTSSDLPKQIPAPPSPPHASTPHYDQQLARLLWVTNTPYPVYQQWKLINRLPEEIKRVNNHKQFKSRLKHFLVSKAFYSSSLTLKKSNSPSDIQENLATIEERATGGTRSPGMAGQRALSLLHRTVRSCCCKALTWYGRSESTFTVTPDCEVVLLYSEIPSAVHRRSPGMAGQRALSLLHRIVQSCCGKERYYQLFTGAHLVWPAREYFHCYTGLCGRVEVKRDTISCSRALTWYGRPESTFTVTPDCAVVLW
ncbi:hypothetical protein J6590_019347 [Homalodisca vitripennis]|nr:hypothetical protein J6590_019347 [Homalodisca vitripennis]